MSGFTRHWLSLLLITTSLGVAHPSVAKTPDIAPAASADVKPEEVGIDEQLGKVVPLDAVFRDEDGHDVTLRSLIDRPTVLTLNYFRCAGICSPQLNGVAETVNRTLAKIGEQYRIITVSFDDRDTPEIAAKKRTNYLQEIRRPVSPNDWRFLTSDAATSKKVADAVGFKFKRVGDDFLHPGALMFLSPKGQVTRYMYGITYVPADWQMAVEEASRGEVQPTINKWLRFCYTYDPAGRHVALNVTRIAGTFVLGSAMIFAIVLIFKGKRKPQNERKA
jgi:protein SCO1/2